MNAYRGKWKAQITQKANIFYCLLTQCWTVKHTTCQTMQMLSIILYAWMCSIFRFLCKQNNLWSHFKKNLLQCTCEYIDTHTKQNAQGNPSQDTFIIRIWEVTLLSQPYRQMSAVLLSLCSSRVKGGHRKRGSSCMRKFLHWDFGCFHFETEAYQNSSGVED